METYLHLQQNHQVPTNAHRQPTKQATTTHGKSSPSFQLHPPPLTSNIHFVSYLTVSHGHTTNYYCPSATHVNHPSHTSCIPTLVQVVVDIIRTKLKLIKNFTKVNRELLFVLLLLHSSMGYVGVVHRATIANSYCLPLLPELNPQLPNYDDDNYSQCSFTSCGTCPLPSFQAE